VRIDLFPVKEDFDQSLQGSANFFPLPNPEKLGRRLILGDNALKLFPRLAGR
jgi:hypothetical protein